MITQQKIKVFEQCGGDADGIGRVLPDSAQEIFDKDAWSTIIGIYQDIEMIKNNVVSDNYKQRAIQFLEHNCDKETATYLKNKIAL